MRPRLLLRPLLKHPRRKSVARVEAATDAVDAVATEAVTAPSVATVRPAKVVVRRAANDKARMPVVRTATLVEKVAAKAEEKPVLREAIVHTATARTARTARVKVPAAKAVSTNPAPRRQTVTPLRAVPIAPHGVNVRANAAKAVVSVASEGKVAVTAVKVAVMAVEKAVAIAARATKKVRRSRPSPARWRQPTPPTCPWPLKVQHRRAM